MPGEGAYAICRFGFARLSSHDLDTAPPHELSRYSAPELLAGAGISRIRLVEPWCRSSGEANARRVLRRHQRPGLPDGCGRERCGHSGGAGRGSAPASAWAAGKRSECALGLGGCRSLGKGRAAPRAGGSASRRTMQKRARSSLAVRPSGRLPNTRLPRAAPRTGSRRAISWRAGQLRHGSRISRQARRMLSALRTLMRREGLDDDARLTLGLKILNPEYAAGARRRTRDPGLAAAASGGGLRADQRADPGASGAVRPRALARAAPEAGSGRAPARGGSSTSSSTRSGFASICSARRGASSMSSGRNCGARRPIAITGDWPR